MYKSILFFCCLCLYFSQALASQETEKISIQFHEQCLHSALCQLAEVSRYRFILQDEITDKIIVTDVKFENTNTSHILQVLLADTDYDYVILYSMVIIFRNIKIQDPTLSSVEGRVYSIVMGRGYYPTRGVTVFLVRGNENDISITRTPSYPHKFLALTDSDGKFFIPSVCENAHIVVELLGFIPRVVSVREAGEIRIEMDLGDYDELVIFGCLCLPPSPEYNKEE